MSRFLSTPSGWRATGCMRFKDLQAKISIHALRVEGDCFVLSNYFVIIEFLSTPSGWRATFATKKRNKIANSISIHALRVEGDAQNRNSILASVISIHALRVEGDRASYIHTRRTNYFYPRPPGGGRPRPRRYTRCNHLFLSTPSGWRATTIAQGQFIGTQGISIHALRVEGD